MATLAPREARSKAIASPMPREAPVTMALLVVLATSCRHKVDGSAAHTLPSSVLGLLDAMLDVVGSARVNTLSSWLVWSMNCCKVSLPM